MTLPPGLCDTWDPIFPRDCALPVDSYAVSGTALGMATETLWALTGRQFGLCSLTIRPCRRSCLDGLTGTSVGGDGGTYPRPALVSGRWYNLTCGSCAGECSCSPVHEIALPGPVFDVTEVKVDGVVLTADVDYRLDNHRLLVRLGGEWPLCNDLNLEDTEIDTWSVTYRVGVVVPTTGQVAAGVLAVEFAKLLLCDDTCALPRYVQSVSRQGVDFTFLDPAEVFANRRTCIYLVDLFINTDNPHGLTQRARVFDLDTPFSRRTGT